MTLETRNSTSETFYMSFTSLTRRCSPPEAILLFLLDICILTLLFSYVADVSRLLDSVATHTRERLCIELTEKKEGEQRFNSRIYYTRISLAERSVIGRLKIWFNYFGTKGDGLAGRSFLQNKKNDRSAGAWTGSEKRQSKFIIQFMLELRV